MQRSFFFTSLLLTTAWSYGLTSPSQAQDVSELFDPAVLARSICRTAQADPARDAFTQIAAAQSAGVSSARPPLWQGLGDLTFKISTTKPLAQQYFDQGLRLSYAFNHDEAIRAFKAAQSIDPACAICYWGEALAWGPNINFAMPEAANAPALAALNRAVQLSASASKKEQALIAALSTRYSSDATAKRGDLDRAYAAAMMKIHQSNADDADVAVLAVEAAMDVAPWDYWQLGGREPKEAMTAAYPLIEKVLAKHPKHAGAIHYYIHIMEQSAWPEKSEPYADVLGPLMPAAGHMVHMPSHTYFRLGRYKDSLTANVAAVAADEAFMAQAEAGMMTSAVYYPHNIHFALESAAMVGDAATSVMMADKLAATIPADSLRTMVMAQPIAMAPTFAHVRFSEPKTILALPDPGNDVPYMKGLWHYARGSAFVLDRDMTAANRELNALVKLQAEADFTALEAAAVPAGAILEVAGHVLRARMAAAKSDWGTAVSELEAAVKGQDALPYMEPAYWYYPARQSLGVALLQAGRAKEAVEVLRRSLIDAPNNGWALYALKEATAVAGDKVAADQYAKLFAKAWSGAKPPALNRI
jgi:tetratricopeptide (TPR) repeat protein